MVDQAELREGDSHSYCLQASGGGPLVVTLVWYDYPSAPNAALLLVNDLDLSVRAAGLAGLEMRGNGWEDDINTVERVSARGSGNCRNIL